MPDRNKTLWGEGTPSLPRMYLGGWGVSAWRGGNTKGTHCRLRAEGMPLVLGPVSATHVPIVGTDCRSTGEGWTQSSGFLFLLCLFLLLPPPSLRLLVAAESPSIISALSLSWVALLFLVLLAQAHWQGVTEAVACLCCVPWHDLEQPRLTLNSWSCPPPKD